SAYIQNTFSSIVWNALIIFHPFIIGKLFTASAIMHVVELHPLMNFVTDSFVKSYYSYGIEKYRIPTFWMNISIEIILGIILLVICPKIFKNKLNKSKD
ncbi:MAG: hypothetical protein Q4E73_11715, partial [Lachnospiraceae bacterium]|nr:hypothetical protein [Lachnospiraceae bacterium]